MTNTEVKTRIQRYRQEYFETAEGRAHLKTATDEAQKVCGVYDELVKKRQAREDITD